MGVQRLADRRNSEGTGSASAHDLLPECLDHLLRRAETLRTHATVVASYGGEFAIHVKATSVPGVHLPADQLKRVADFGLSVDVDIIMIAAE